MATRFFDISVDSIRSNTHAINWNYGADREIFSKTAAKAAVRDRNSIANPEVSLNCRRA
jgi:hypothetical protein